MSCGKNENYAADSRMSKNPTIFKQNKISIIDFLKKNQSPKQH